MSGLIHRAIPILDLTPKDELWGVLNAAFQWVPRSIELILGQEAEAVKGEIADYQGATGVNSGTDGLVIGLSANVVVGAQSHDRRRRQGGA